MGNYNWDLDKLRYLSGLADQPNDDKRFVSESTKTNKNSLKEISLKERIQENFDKMELDEQSAQAPVYNQLARAFKNNSAIFGRAIDEYIEVVKEERGEKSRPPVDEIIKRIENIYRNAPKPSPIQLDRTILTNKRNQMQEYEKLPVIPTSELNAVK